MLLDANLDPVAWTTSACAFSAGTPAATCAKWSTLLRRLAARPVTIGGGSCCPGAA